MSGEYTPEQLLADLTKAQGELDELSKKNKEDLETLKWYRKEYPRLEAKYKELEERYEQILEKLVDKI